MKQVSGRAFARAGLLGNPSDGYHGKTISFIVPHFCAEVTLTQSPVFEIHPLPDERRTFASLQDFHRSVAAEGYYGSERLIKAALKRFVDFFGPALDSNRPCFSVQAQTNIPRQVGLAGSSAIVMATLRAALDWYELTLAPEILASLTLAVEQDELGIPAGLQDRVIQAMEGLVFMDFSREKMTRQQGLEVGVYERLDPQLLRNVYVAYTLNPGEPTEVFHSDLRSRFRSGEPQVVQAMRSFADLAERGKQALLAGDQTMLFELINANFDLRRSLCTLNPRHVEMVEAARRAGAAAKFCGSGGAIVGIFPDRPILQRLIASLANLQCRVLTFPLPISLGR